MNRTDALLATAQVLRVLSLGPLVLLIGCVAAWQVAAGPTIDGQRRVGAAVRVSYLMGAVNSHRDALGMVGTVGAVADSKAGDGGFARLGIDYLSPPGPVLLRAGFGFAGRIGTGGAMPGIEGEVMGLVPLTRSRDSRRWTTRPAYSVRERSERTRSIGLDATAAAWFASYTDTYGEYFLGVVYEDAKMVSISTSP